MLQISIFSLFIVFFNWILELLRQQDIFSFSFDFYDFIFGYFSNCSDIRVFLCFPFHFYDLSVDDWKCSHSAVSLFFYFLLLYVSVLENPVQYRIAIGQRVDVGILGVVTVQSAVDCACQCHQHINCNHFNFGRISMKCELVGARKTDSKTNINYDVYSQC